MSKQDADGIKFFFEPSSIAIAGVSPDQTKLASIIFSNLLKNRAEGILKASLYPLNPAHKRVGGLRCYSNLKDLPEVPDLLVIAVPAARAPGLVTEAADTGVKAVLMIAGGFAEAGRKESEDAILEVASRRRMRVLGPNTIGVLDTKSGVDTLFLRETKRLESGEEVVSLLKPLKGGVVIITQSGHLGEVISEELAAEGIGLRALVGTGNQLDVSVEDVVRYFSEDDETKAIGVYLEGVKDGRRFIEVVRAASRMKPVVVFKVGKTSTGARAALTHTASLVGDFEAYRAAFRAAGVVEAESLQELPDYCMTFSLLSQRPGKRLLIVTNAGGVGAVAADEAERAGLEVKPLRTPLVSLLRKRFEGSSFVSIASLGNPLDLTASASTSDFAEATGIVLASPDYDLALVLPTHQTPAIGPDISSRVAKSVLKTGKPVCVSVMGRAPLAGMIHTDFIRKGIPSFPTPERAVRALAALSNYSRLRLSAGPLLPVSTRDKFGYLKNLRGALTVRQTQLLLSRYRITQPNSMLVEKEADLTKASDMKFPVACKLASRGLLHKAAMGGVILNVPDREAVVTAFSKLKIMATKRDLPFEGMLVQEMVDGDVELILGATRDGTFGPVVLFGAGGSNAELAPDHSVALAPVDSKNALEMVLRTRVGSALGIASKGKPSILENVIPVVANFSKIMAENPSIAQIEVNPLIVTLRKVLAVDARVVLRD